MDLRAVLVRCEECGSRGEHEMWCSVGGSLMAEKDPEETIWFAITETGRRMRFTMSPSADEGKALRYAQTHPERFGDWTPIVKVEAK